MDGGTALIVLFDDMALFDKKPATPPHKVRPVDHQWLARPVCFEAY